MIRLEHTTSHTSSRLAVSPSLNFSLFLFIVALPSQSQIAFLRRSGCAVRPTYGFFKVKPAKVDLVYEMVVFG